MTSTPDAGPPPALTPKNLVRQSTAVYGVMALIGLLVTRFGHKTLRQAVAIPYDLEDACRLGLIGIVGAGLLLVLSYFFEDWFPSYRQLKGVMMRLLGPSSVKATVYLATITAIGEELLFRGAIQPFAGLVVTSVLFGLMHMTRERPISTWSVWAFLAGLLLGWMYDATQSLWPPTVAHFGVNLVSILALRRAYRGAAAAPATAVPRDSDS